MTENSNICRICLTVINFNISTDVNTTRQQMLKLVSPNSNIAAFTKSLLCERCSECLQKSYDFKTICLNNEHNLNNFRYENNSKLILQEVVPKENKIKSEIKQEYEMVCRLCFSYFSSECFTDLSRIEDDIFLKDMIEQCLPEIDLNATQDVFMCQDCTNSLQSQFNLVSTLSDTNDKIDDYIYYNNMNNNRTNINLGQVLEFIVYIQGERKNECSPLIIKEEMKVEIIDDDLSGICVKEEDISLFKEENDRAPSASDQFPDRETLVRNSAGAYACPYCSHTTSARPNLMLHLRTHQDSRPLKCDQCDFTTKWPSCIVQHSWLHRDKTVEKLHKCEFCPYTSRYLKHVRRHGRRHQAPGTLPTFKCKHCKFESNDKSYFKLHNKKKHNEEVPFEADDKTFPCDGCEFVANKKCLLTRHRKRMHKSVVCEVCGHKSSSLWHLNQHKIRHKGETEVPMFQCFICNFRTKHKNSLKSHILKHRQKDGKE